MADPTGWSGLFWDAFKRSRNPMVLLDELRCHVEVNGAYIELLGYRRAELIGHPIYELVEGGPVMTDEEWRAAIERPHFAGVAHMIRADGGKVTAQFAGHSEIVTGRRLVLGVAINTARAGRRLHEHAEDAAGELSEREREIVRLIALGYDGPEIAAELQLSPHTVRTHVRNAMKKLGARSRAHLVAKSLGDGIAL